MSNGHKCETIIVIVMGAKTHDVVGLNSKMVGQSVVLGGWIEDLRKMGKMTFATLRDASGRCQVIAKGEAAVKMDEISRQSVVLVEGVIQDTRARDFEFEIAANTITLLSPAVHPLPVDPMGRLESNIDTRLNHRALDMRNPKTAAIFRMRHVALQSIRRTLSDQFTEITTPKVIGSASEGGADLFSLEYFGRTAYLAQSPQLYKEQMTLGLERVFEVSSFYRAENSHTGRHLTEFTSVDVEAAFMDYNDVMNVLETLVVQVYQDVSTQCSADLELRNHTLDVPSGPFDVITYSDAINDLARDGIELEFGDDLQDSHLHILGKRHPGFFFLTDWPLKLKPFYIMGKNGELSESFDLQYGYLELSSGGTRLHDPDIIKTRLREQDLSPDNFQNHLDTFCWGMPPHAGWGLGMDRLMTILSGASNVRETVLYPRDPDRLLP